MRKGSRGTHEFHEPWTMPELHRAKQLVEAGMPCGSVAILLTVDYGTHRNAAKVREAVRNHFGVKSRNPRSPNGFRVGSKHA